MHRTLLSSAASVLIAGASLFGHGFGTDIAPVGAGGAGGRPLTRKQAKARAASKRARKARRITKEK